jgi:cobalt-zinc-cadmium efflux system outer membrane protein
MTSAPMIRGQTPRAGSTRAFDPQQRADLRAARSRLAAADAGVALARSERHRDIQLGVEAEREPTDISGVTWGVSLTIPLGGPSRTRRDPACRGRP